MTKSKTWTMRERMLAVVRQQEVDRVPFVQYSGLAGPDQEAWDLVGRDQLGLLQWCGAWSVTQPHCRYEGARAEIDGRPGLRNTIHTPKGSLTEERLLEPVFNSSAAHRHFVRQPADYEILLAWLKDTVVRENFAELKAVVDRLGDDGLPHLAVCRTPYQQLWVQWVSPVELSWHLVEHADLVAACTDEMGRILNEMMEIARRADAPYVIFPDNITAPMTGPRLFRQYCAPYYRRLAELLADRGTPVFVHMDGDLKPLWAAIGESGVRGLDSMSPPPDNDTSVADALRVWPQMSVCINFPSSVHLQPPAKIRAATLEILAQGGRSRRLQIQISENVPPDRWRVSYPAIVGAINEVARRQ